MKKTFTFLAAMMMLGAVCMAQGSIIRSAKQSNLPAAFSKQVVAVKGQNDVKRFATKAVAFSHPVWNSDTMSYCGDDAFATGVGVGSDTSTMYWGIKIDADALVGRNTITEVQFYAELIGAYTMSLVFGADPTETATLTQTINITAADTGAWKTVTLSPAVPVAEGEDLWVTFSCMRNFPAAGVEGSSYPNGTYVSLDGTTWGPLVNYTTQLDLTWMIRVVSDTHIFPAPMFEVEGPDAVITGVANTWIASSPNTDTWEWTVNGTVQSTSDTLTYTFDTDADSNEIILTATNNNGGNSVSLVFWVESYSCNGITELPYTYGFERGMYCWNMVSADNANDNRMGVREDTNAHEGFNEFVFSSYSSAPSDNYNQFLISPEMTLPSESQYMVKFWYKGYNSRESFRVLASSTTDDTAAFTEVLGDMPTVSTEWTLAAYVLPANTKYVAINYYANFQYYLYIDEVSIEELSAPMVSVNGHDRIKVGNVARYSAHSILADTLEWIVDGNEVTGTDNTLTYIFDTEGDHIVVAKATNSVGFSTDTAFVEVFDCPANTIPYAPSFANGFGCWDTVSLLTHGAGWYTFEGEIAEMGQVYSMSAQSSFFGMMDLDIDNWLISHYIASAEGNYEIAWQVRPFDMDYHSDHYGVYVINGSDTTLLFEETMGTDTNYAWRTISLPANLDDNFRIAFRHFNCAGGFILLLDSIQVRALTAPMVTLAGPAVAVVGEEATYTATSGTATSYSWTVDGRDANESTNVLNVTFDAAASHTIVVTAINAAGNDTASLDVTSIVCEANTEFPWTENFENANVYGCWKFIDADGDGHNWDTDFLRNETSESGSYYGHNNSRGLVSSASYVNHALTPDNWMILPAMTLPEGSEMILSWYDKGLEPEYFAERYSVYISTTGRNISDFTTAAANFTTQNSWIGRNVDLSQYAGQTIYIAFRHHDCTDMFYLNIDDIKISTERVSIDEVETSALSLYPNPASQMVSISAEGVEGNVNVQIVDMNGRVMMEQQGNAQSFRFDVSGLAQGAYFVRMTGENINAVHKLVVK